MEMHPGLCLSTCTMDTETWTSQSSDWNLHFFQHLHAEGWQCVFCIHTYECLSHMEDLNLSQFATVGKISWNRVIKWRSSICMCVYYTHRYSLWYIHIVCSTCVCTHMFMYLCLFLHVWLCIYHSPPGSAITYSAYVIPDKWVNSSFHQYYIPIAVVNTVICTALACYSR
jgi:hypothetical protein